MQKPFISRVVINNYKSIAHCDVQLGALQFLVGRNGAGKSNFLDALAFVRDVLEFNNLESAAGGLNIFHKWERETQSNLGMKIEFNLPNGANGVFAFNFAWEELEHVVTEESCWIRQNGETKEYKTQNGKLLSDDPQRFPPVASDRFYLQNMSAYEAFRPLYDALRKIQIYNFVPQEIPPIDTISNLWFMSDGRNIAQVVSDLTEGAQNRVREYLQLVVPDIHDFSFCKVGGRREGREGIYLEFMHKAGGFFHENISYGTLRALCVLTALLQERQSGENNHPVLIGIEEPENGIHARATRALLGAMLEATNMRQVIVATHSTEMLDSEEVASEQILPVEMGDSGTVIAPMDDITKEMLRDHLTTAGELLRQDQLEPENLSSVSDSNK